MPCQHVERNLEKVGNVKWQLDNIVDTISDKCANEGDTGAVDGCNKRKIRMALPDRVDSAN
jgi:hypothetical protein